MALVTPMLVWDRALQTGNIARRQEEMHHYFITANRLKDGVVVFYTADGSWSAAVADALRCDKAASPELTKASLDVTQVVGVYAVEADDGPDGPRPLLRRERIRLGGPTIDFAATDFMGRS